jgi:hypothetical protein
MFLSIELFVGRQVPCYPRIFVTPHWRSLRTIIVHPAGEKDTPS